MLCSPHWATESAAKRGFRPLDRRRRPPARGGPTIDDAFVPLVEGSYIVGPPLAGGLPGARTGFSSRLWGWPYYTRPFYPLYKPRKEPSSIVGPPLAGGLRGLLRRDWPAPARLACSVRGLLGAWPAPARLACSVRGLLGAWPAPA